MSTRKVFVTVGTTQFDDLITTASSTVVTKVLQELKYTDLLLQIGNGQEPKNKDSKHLNIQFYTFKKSIDEDINNASLVISHAGSGSIMDVLGAGKPLLVIINENLMDNHQIEVATKFAEEGFLYFCTPSKMAETLQTARFDDLKPYISGDPNIFANFLDSIMGFSKPD